MSEKSLIGIQFTVLDKAAKDTAVELASEDVNPFIKKMLDEFSVYDNVPIVYQHGFNNGMKWGLAIGGSIAVGAIVTAVYEIRKAKKTPEED